MAATATCPSVNTYPGTCLHAHTHTRPQLSSPKDLCVCPDGLRDPHDHTHTSTKGHWDIQIPNVFMNTLGTCAATRLPLLLVPSLLHVAILLVAGS